MMDMTDEVPVRGDPMVYQKLPWRLEVIADWHDCEHGIHEFRASIYWPNEDLETESGCGASMYAAIRDALKKTPVVA